MAVQHTYRYLPANLADTLRGVGFVSRFPMSGTVQGLHRSPHRGVSVEFAEYRDYVPGDDPGMIDWAVYARTDRYVIREFHEETNLQCRILLDCSNSMGYQSAGPCTKYDFACYLAAGLMYMLITQGDLAGMMLFGNELEKVYEPFSLLEGLRPVLLDLEARKPAGEGRIDHCLHKAAERIRRRSVVVVISDFLQDAGVIHQAVQHLRHDRHDVVLLQVADGDELALGFGGLSELEDLETGQRMVVDMDEVREHYLAAVRSHVDALRLGASRCGARHVLADTRSAPADVLVKQLGSMH